MALAPRPPRVHQPDLTDARRISDGKHRGTDPQDHGSSADRTGARTGRTTDKAKATPDSGTTAIPYAGIRAGEIIGHRLWWLIQCPGFTPCLSSLAHFRVWHPGEIVVGDVDQIICRYLVELRGGVYAFKHFNDCLAAFRANGLSSPGMVIVGMVVGTVKLWGEVVEHRRGYRAQYARVHTLDQIAYYAGRGQAKQFRVERLREIYGVGTLIE